MTSALGQPNVITIAWFAIFIVLSLGITVWAARRTRSTDHFYAAGRSVSALQNGLALAGDYMSAASFLGIAGLVALSGFDGLIYSVGWLVGWPIVMFLIAEPLRNLGKYTFADVVAFRLRQTPVRIASAIGGILTVLLYTIAQMVGAGNLIKLMFGIPYEAAVIIVGAVMLAYEGANAAPRVAPVLAASRERFSRTRMVASYAALIEGVVNGVGLDEGHVRS